MNTTVIICEYNPFTNGHLHHLQSARAQTGCDTLICIMSGSFTQRGEGAILDKYLRAETAVRCGADMVVELPLIYSISPADNFAYGAIKTIASLPDVNCISFGTECGNAELLTKTADFLANEPQEYKDLLANYQKEGNSFPKSRSLALIDYANLHTEFADIQYILDKPNDILGIAYIQALKKFNLNIKIHTVKRESDYNSTSLTEEKPSASAVRMAMLNDDWNTIKNCVPSYTFNLLQTYKPRTSSLGDLCLYKLKDINGHELENYYDISGGIHNRLKLSAETAVSYEQFLELAKTKKYTMARIKRLSLYALFDITQDMYTEAQNLTGYIFILALNKDRKDILTACNQVCDNVLTKYSDINKVDKSIRSMIKLDFKAQGVLSMVNRSDYYNKTMLLI